MCNPIMQAKLLNSEKTDLNIVIGLCVGHDSLFYKYSDALCTTLVTKDRGPRPQPCRGALSGRVILFEADEIALRRAQARLSGIRYRFGEQPHCQITLR